MSEIFERINNFFGRIDKSLFISILLLAVVGIFNLTSVTEAINHTGVLIHWKQVLWTTCGFTMIFGALFIRFRTIQRMSYPFFALGVLLLILVLLIGSEYNGAKRWISLGFLTMQPSEFMKVAVIMFTAKYFQDQDLGHPYTLRELAKPTLIVFGACFLILKEPDLGTALLVLAIYGTMVLFEGVRWSSLLGIVAAIIISMPFVWTIGMHEYQRDRVVAFLRLEDDDLGQSWQVRQSIIAFGSGQVTGKGYKKGTQVQKGFVPENENDFVAANWGEEHGFLGMCALIGLYFLLILSLLRVAVRSYDKYGALIAVGTAAMVFWHVSVNIGMVTGSLPVVGLTLPLLSAGGSSLLTFYFLFALSMAVAARKRSK